MTITRNYNGGGGTLTRKLCNLPKGGGADDRTQCRGRLPVPSGRLPVYREPHASVHELARHQLGAGTRADDTGRQQGLSGWQRGRRSGAHADAAGNAKPCTLRATRLFGVWRAKSGRIAWHRRGQRQSLFGGRYRKLDVRVLRPDGSGRRRASTQQLAALPRGVHLAAHCVIPERGCAA